MSLLDKLLGLKLVEQESSTETAWWEESVVRGLAGDWVDDDTGDQEPDSEFSLRPGGLH